MRVTVHPLTAKHFAPFGDVIEAGEEANSFPINQGHSRRFHDLAKIDIEANNGRLGVSIFRSTPLPLPLRIEVMERHPLSSQAFIPLSPNPYLVVVAPAGDFQSEQMQFFLASAKQGVNYHAGTWHHFSLALNSPSDFLVLDRIGTGDNCDQVTLATAIVIHGEDLPQ